MEMLDGSRHRGQTHVFFQNKHIMGSYLNSDLLELSSDFLFNFNSNLAIDPDFPLTSQDESIKRTRICRNWNSPTYERIRIDRFQLDMLQGVGTEDEVFAPIFITTEAGDDLAAESGLTLITEDSFDTVVVANENDEAPQVFLSISEDGGITYHNFGEAPIGKIGQRLRRTIWRRLGVRRDNILKFEMYNRVPIYIIGAAIDQEVLPE